MLGRVKVRASRAAVITTTIAVSVALAVGCSGKSTSNGDDETGDAGDGATSTGGNGFGGTTSFGGTGGTGGPDRPVDGVCLNVCQRVQTCPGAAAADCSAVCQEEADEAAAAGCTAAYNDFLACWAQMTDVCSTSAGPCDEAVSAYILCINDSGGGGTGGCMPGSVPVNTSCSSLCSRLNACPDATTTCTTDCASAISEAAATGCSIEYDALLGCASTCADICSLEADDCPAEIEGYSSCVSEFCVTNPNATPCL